MLEFKCQDNHIVMERRRSQVQVSPVHMSYTRYTHVRVLRGCTTYMISERFLICFNEINEERVLEYHKNQAA